MTDNRPLEDLTNEISQRATHGLGQGLAMRDAATVLMATHEFAQWVAVHQGSGRDLHPADVVKFYMSYARALIEPHVTTASADQPDLDL